MDALSFLFDTDYNSVVKNKKYYIEWKFMPCTFKVVLTIGVLQQFKLRKFYISMYINLTVVFFNNSNRGKRGRNVVL